METKEITNLSGFIKETESLGFQTDEDLIIFRGQPIKGNLIPGIARKDTKNDTTLSEKKILEQLELMGASFLGASSTNKLELLVLAQHSRLKTRLLDWTSNPLVALWFACSEGLNKDPDEDTYVYALKAQDFLIQNVYDEDPFTNKKTRVFQPRLSNPRIIAQHGWFTLHRYSKTSSKFVSLEKNKDIEKYLTEFHIKKQYVKAIFESLERHGVSQRTLFPDLEGLCGYLNWRYAK